MDQWGLDMWNSVQVTWHDDMADDVIKVGELGNDTCPSDDVVVSWHGDVGDD